MGRKQVDINPECGKKLSEWMKYIGISQAKLAELTGYSQQHISQIVNGKKRMTRDFAIRVSNTVYKRLEKNDVVSEYSEEINRIRPEYLLCEDEENRTIADKILTDLKQSNTERKACETLLTSSIQEVCRKEGIPVPEFTPFDIPKYLFLEAQLKDYCDFLVRCYIKGPNESRVWSRLEEEGAFDVDKKEG